jgi:hypothetical protein
VTSRQHFAEWRLIIHVLHSVEVTELLVETAGAVLFYCESSALSSDGRHIISVTL